MPDYFYDPLYGKVEIPNLLQPIVDSFWFRRLQYLRQLGLCYLSFPGGNHTRFEHSVGTFHLANLISKFQLIYHEKPQDGRSQVRFGHLMQLAALCHDLGHGPYSHMTENVLLGLGASVTHEEMSAAIVVHELQDAIKPFEEWEITPALVGQIITKQKGDDPVANCVIDIISADLDLDRIDYLHRDAHYSGFDPRSFDPVIDLAGIWHLANFNGQLALVLSEKGVRFAERVLFMRRNSYQSVVFESRHMCATAMFEKAIWLAAGSKTEFSKRCADVVGITECDWRSQRFYKQAFPIIMRLYGLVDHEALRLLEGTLADVGFLVRRIRRGRLYESVRSYNWSQLHFLTKQLLLDVKSSSHLFKLRRQLEANIARKLNEHARDIVSHVPRVIPGRPLTIGTVSGRLLEEISALAQFFKDDYIKTYTIEIYCNPDIEAKLKQQAGELADDLFIRGDLSLISPTGL